jgi:hypothetical protein
MKVETNTKTLERVGVKSESEFTITANAQAFKILSDGLYSDKPRAILRELSCNAYDAHVDAGNAEKPFNIQMPNPIDPTFRIRDYGTGLSPDDMLSVYKTYFQSTKTDTNDQIGCLGLGSKSPFAYTDSFTTTTYYNGVKYIYNAHINESGTPAIALMGKTKTTEHNGLEISFTVERSDFREFEYKIQPVFQYFKLMPNISGIDTRPEPVKYMMKKDGWALRKVDKSRYSNHRNYANHGVAMAVMGNVAYPIDNMDTGDMSNDERSLLSQGGLDIFFDIGDLEVQPSREGLAFNKRTIKNIRERLDKIITEIRKEANAQISTCKTLWEARIEATKINAGEYSHLNYIFEGQNIFSWNGTSLSTDGYCRVNDKASGILEDDFSILMFESYSSHRANSGTGIRKSTSQTVRASEDARIYLNDIKKGQHIRCRQEAIQDGVGSVYLLSCDKPAVLEKIMARLGVTKIKSISEVEVVKVSTSGVRSASNTLYNPKNSQKILAYNTDMDTQVYGTHSSYWNKAEVDLDKGGIYVEITRYKVTGGGQPSGSDQASCVMEYFNSLLKSIDENKDLKVYGIKPSMIEKEEIGNKKNWILLSDYVKAKVEKYVKDKTRMSKVVEYKSWLKYDRNSYYRGDGPLDEMLKFAYEKGVKGGKDLTAYMTLLKDMEASRKLGMPNLVNLLDRMGIQIDEKDKLIKVRDFEKMAKAVGTRYPLMKCIHTSYVRGEIKAVQEYVDAIDLVK